MRGSGQEPTVGGIALEADGAIGGSAALRSGGLNASPPDVSGPLAKPDSAADPPLAPRAGIANLGAGVRPGPAATLEVEMAASGTDPMAREGAPKGGTKA